MDNVSNNSNTNPIKGIHLGSTNKAEATEAKSVAKQSGQASNPALGAFGQIIVSNATDTKGNVLNTEGLSKLYDAITVADTVTNEIAPDLPEELQAQIYSELNTVDHGSELQGHMTVSSDGRLLSKNAVSKLDQALERAEIEDFVMQIAPDADPVEAARLNDFYQTIDSTNYGSLAA